MSRRLYKFFTITTGDAWFYTDAKSAITFEGTTYNAREITITRLPQTIGENEGEIECPGEMPPINQFLIGNPPGTLFVRIQTISLDLLSAKPLATGRVGNVDYAGRRGMAKVPFRSISSILSSDASGRRYGTECQWIFGDSDCSIDLDSKTGGAFDFKRVLQVSDVTIDGLTMQHADFADFSDGFFTRGVARIGAESIFITKHVGDTLTVLSPFRRFPGDSMEIIAGCDLKLDTCEDRFSNELNFGGFAFVPDRDPILEGFR